MAESTEVKSPRIQQKSRTFGYQLIVLDVNLDTLEIVANDGTKFIPPQELSDAIALIRSIPIGEALEKLSEEEQLAIESKLDEYIAACADVKTKYWDMINTTFIERYGAPRDTVTVIH